jgi:hypothetical protein
LWMLNMGRRLSASQASNQREQKKRTEIDEKENNPQSLSR